MLFAIAAGIMVLCLIIVIHELGHFFAAKACGVKVEAFSLGFWKVLWSFKFCGTEYRISAIPFGGYVEMKGESINSEGDNYGDSCDRDSLPGCGYIRRCVIMLAGPCANAVLAYVCFCTFIMMGAYTHPPVVGVVDQNCIAATAGIRSGDRIVRFNGVEISTWNEISRMFIFTEGSLPLTVRRDGHLVTLEVKAPVNGNSNQPKTILSKVFGATPVEQKIWYQPGLFESFSKSWQAMTFMTVFTGKMFLWLATGGIPVSDISGPVMIVKQTGDVAVLGMAKLLIFISLISLNIGFTNLLPIPLMDGGQVILATIEAVRKKTFSRKAIERLSWASVILLGGVMVFTLVNDVRLLLKL